MTLSHSRGEFSDQELQQMFHALRDAVTACRTNQAAENRAGLLNIPSHVQPIFAQDIQQIPTGSVAITCACGGTNWIFTIARKEANGTFELEQGFIRPIPESERTHTFNSLMQIIADEIMNVIYTFHLESVDQLPIAISFGFPQSNIRVENGDVDARITSSSLPKLWRITDCDETRVAEDQPSLAGILRRILQDRGVHSIGRIVFVNDTTAVVLDVEPESSILTLPVGFVFGTGTNAAIAGDVESGIINLESGHATVVPPDATTRIMQERGWIPSHAPWLEYWIGGAYLPKRVAAAILSERQRLTDAEQVVETILNTTQQTLLSDIASGESPKNIGFHIGPDEYTFIRDCVQTVLHHAGQLIGVTIAAVCSAVGYEGGSVHVPYEGSLYTKGFGIADVARHTTQTLIPGAEITLTHASGMRGVAKLALVLTNKSKV